MDTEFAKWLATLGVGGTLAAFMFLFYRKDVKQYTELWRAQAEMSRLQTDKLIDVIEKIATVNTQLVLTVDALHRRLDEADYPHSIKPKGLITAPT